MKIAKVNIPSNFQETLPKLVQKYDSRIKNFLYEVNKFLKKNQMASSPIVIKDYINPIENVRKENTIHNIIKIQKKEKFNLSKSPQTQRISPKVQYKSYPRSQ